MIQEIIGIIFLIIGAAFMLISALGVVRMPDLYLRMSASTKSSTLGVSAILIATAFFFNDLSISSRVIAIITFLLLTAPVAAHMMGRAAYSTGVKLWAGTHHDDLKDRYKKRTRKRSNNVTDEFPVINADADNA